MGRGVVSEQRGAILIVVLIFLSVLLMIGVSAMQGAILEEKMAGNSWEQTRAFHAAESAMEDGASWIVAQSTAIEATSSGAHGVWIKGTVNAVIAAANYNWDARGKSYGSDTGTSSSAFAGLHKLPRYIIEETAFVLDDIDADSKPLSKGVFYYTIIAVGYGATDSAKAELESVIQKRYQ